MRITMMLMTLLLLAAGDPLPGADDCCDQYIKDRAVPGSYGYREREQGRRCEGAYESEISAPRFEVISFLVGDLDYTLGGHETLSVSAATMDATTKETLAGGKIAVDPVRVRSLSLLRGSYYRLDGLCFGNGPLRWPVDDVLEALDLEAHEIGVYGWIGPEVSPTYIPLIIRHSGEIADTAAPILLHVRYNNDVAKIECCVYQPGGCVKIPIQLQGNIPAGWPITVALPPGPPGIVRILYTAYYGGQWHDQDVVIYRPGAGR